MNGYEIESAIRADRHVAAQYHGTYAADTLPRHISKLPALLVVNSRPNNHPGEHWLAIAIDKDAVGEYFDSYGRPPVVKSHEDFLHRNCRRWRYNHTLLQDIGSDVCGQYCVTYLIHKAHHISAADFVKAYFSKDCQKNDCIVEAMFKRYSKRTKLCQDLLLTCNKQKCCPRRV